MDKKSQVEEIAKEREEIREIMRILDKCVSLNPMYKAEVATVIYGNSYRKVDENSVVLTNTEYQKYLAYKIIEPQVKGCLDRERELQKQVDELKEELGLQKTLYNRARECGYNTGYNSAVKDTAPVAVNRFINQLHIDGVLVDDGDSRTELRKVKALVLKRYYNVEVNDD